MPLAAFAIGHILSLPPELLVGMVLLGSSPGGTSSNVMAYLARANVALSVTMTMASTLLAVVATPVLTWLLVGRTVPVDVGAMLFNMIQIVLAPVLIGVLLNTFFPHRLARLRPLLPMVAMTAILIIIAVIVAASKEQLARAALVLVVAVMLHNLTGFAAGYGIARWLGFDEPTCRTLSIEVGMQNSGLSVALAMRFFSPMAALPGAIFSIWHTIAGALLAGYWSSRRSDPAPTAAAE
jgi:BASS family bile acid:Na+ symporter